MDFKWTLDWLADWAKAWDPAEQERCLVCPHASVWPKSEDFFEARIQQLCTNLGHNLTPLFQAVCLASHLLAPDRTPDRGLHWMQEAFEPGDFGLPLCWGDDLQGQWVRIPFVQAGPGGALVRYGLVGRLPRYLNGFCPDWAEDCLDEEALDAVRISLELAEQRFGRRFFFWPLLPFVERRCLHQDSSLGLPVYLGCISAAKGIRVPPLLCTGSLEPDAGLSQVGRLEQKVQIGKVSGFQAFMYPGLGDMDIQRIEAHGVEALPVQDLTAAEVLWYAFQPGQGDNILRILSSLDEPVDLAANLPQASGPILTWLAGEENLLGIGLRKILGSKEALEEFVKQLEEELEQPEWSMSGLSALLAAFEQEAMFDSVALSRPDLAFRVNQISIRLGLV